MGGETEGGGRSEEGATGAGEGGDDGGRGGRVLRREGARQGRVKGGGRQGG